MGREAPRRAAPRPLRLGHREKGAGVRVETSEAGEASGPEARGGSAQARARGREDGGRVQVSVGGPRARVWTLADGGFL